MKKINLGIALVYSSIIMYLLNIVSSDHFAAGQALPYFSGETYQTITKANWITDGYYLLFFALGTILILYSWATDLYKLLKK
jgi:glucose uptake protein GlcU